MKTARLPSARSLFSPFYFAIAIAGCGSVTALDLSEDGGSTTSLPREDAGQIAVKDVSKDGAVLDAAPKTPTAKSADAAAAPAPAPSTNKDAGIGADLKGAGAVSTDGCTTKNDCGGLFCSLPNGICVECLVDQDCKGKSKLCDANSLTCVGCADDCGDRD